MQNFFNTNSEQPSVPLESQYDSLKDNYQQIFIEAAESIRAAIEKFKPVNPCTICSVKNCNIEKKDVFTDYPVGCAYRDWQKQVLSFLEGEYKQRLKNTYKMIMDKKCEYECIKCANCCRLATSEYSYEQLKQRAMRGDKYSKDFVSVFVPYKSEEEAKLANPEYFKLLEDMMENQKVYYYYCPKLVGNLCSDYENRPNICKDFPHNPLKLLPSTCSFNAWKNEIAKQSMLLKAKTDIINFYKAKLG
jgi:Fe-S-cluster containining protein